MSSLPVIVEVPTLEVDVNTPSDERSPEIAGAIKMLLDLLTNEFPVAAVGVGSIPGIVLRCMVIAKDFTRLSGPQKNAAVSDAISTWIKGLEGIHVEEQVIMMALLPALVPALINLNYYIDTTAEMLFVKAKARCSTFACFKGQ